MMKKIIIVFVFLVMCLGFSAKVSLAEFDFVESIDMIIDNYNQQSKIFNDVKDYLISIDAGSEENLLAVNEKLKEKDEELDEIYRSNEKLLALGPPDQIKDILVRLNEVIYTLEEGMKVIADDLPQKNNKTLQYGLNKIIDAGEKHTNLFGNIESLSRGYETEIADQVGENEDEMVYEDAEYESMETEEEINWSEEFQISKEFKGAMGNIYKMGLFYAFLFLSLFVLFLAKKSGWIVSKTTEKLEICELDKDSLSLGGIMRMAWKAVKLRPFAFLFCYLLIGVPANMFLVWYQEPITLADGGVYLSFWIVISLCVSFFDLVIAYIAFNSFEGRYMGFLESFSFIFRNIPKLLFTLLVLTGLLLGLFFLFAIPAFIFLVYWNFAFLSVVISQKWGWAALKESRNIINGRWWLLFAYLTIFNGLSLMIWNILDRLRNKEVISDAWYFIGGTFSEMFSVFGTIVLVAVFLNWKKIKEAEGNIGEDVEISKELDLEAVKEKIRKSGRILIFSNLANILLLITFSILFGIFISRSHDNLPGLSLLAAILFVLNFIWIGFCLVTYFGLKKERLWAKNCAIVIGALQLMGILTFPFGLYLILVLSHGDVEKYFLQKKSL